MKAWIKYFYLKEFVISNTRWCPTLPWWPARCSVRRRTTGWRSSRAWHSHCRRWESTRSEPISSFEPFPKFVDLNHRKYIIFLKLTINEYSALFSLVFTTLFTDIWDCDINRKLSRWRTPRTPCLPWSGRGWRPRRGRWRPPLR